MACAVQLPSTEGQSFLMVDDCPLTQYRELPARSSIWYCPEDPMSDLAFDPRGSNAQTSGQNFPSSFSTFVHTAEHLSSAFDKLATSLS